MSSRSLRRTASIIAFAALLAPVSGLHAAQGRQQRTPANATAQAHHSPLVELVLRLLHAAGVQVDTGLNIDGNG